MPAGPGFAARSDVGVTRAGNEDRFLARPPLFAVADGMGGHQGGEVASDLAVRLLDETANQSPAPGSDDVVDAIERSNTAIREEGRRHAELSGMGTTCTVVVIDDDVHVAHVGDSRAYRLRGARLEQLTEDHSLVASMVREGIIAPADAMTDGRRNIITRALGAEDQVRVDVVTTERVAGDRLLLCSDGLHSQVDDATIAGVLLEEADPGRAVDRLIDLANAAGGEDNVTIIVIDPDVVIGPVADEEAAEVEDDGPVPEVDAGVGDEPGANTEGPGSVRAEPSRDRRARALVFLVLLIGAALALAVVGWLLAGTTVPA